VPPPPVAGAAVGSGLADGLGVADAGAACVTVGVTVGVPDGDTELLAEVLALTLAEPLAVLLDETAPVGEVVPAGENEVGTDEGVDPVQAETAAEASMTMAPQPMTANLALSPVPAMVVRTFMEPPQAPGRWRPRFRVPAPEPTSQGNAWRSGRCPPAGGRSPKSAAIKARPVDGTGTR
jgi:hypothetical protein